MNRIKIISLVAFALAVTVTAGAAERFRTDINPALLYHRAFLLKPDLPAEDREYLFEREWRGQPLDARFGELVSKYDNMFKLLRQAAHAEVPCDWGVDLTAGPEVWLPSLAQAKVAAQAARLRAPWFLQNGRPDDARDDLLAAFALGRNVSRDAILISALVQIAIENIVASAIAENFYQFSPETLKQLADGFDASPARGTIAQCVPVEKYAFRDWFVRKILQFKEQNPGNDARVLELIREFQRNLIAEDDTEADFTEKLIRAGGGTSDGVLRLLQELDPWYERVTHLLTLPYHEFDPQMTIFEGDVAASPNPLIRKFFTVFRKCREREFQAVIRLTMIRAAAEYKLRGTEGLESVKDPFASGPFAFRRFVFSGEDRGFELKSAYRARDYDEVLIFVEKNGPPFRLDGKNVGQPLPKPAAR